MTKQKWDSKTVHVQRVLRIKKTFRKSKKINRYRASNFRLTPVKLAIHTYFIPKVGKMFLLVVQRKHGMYVDDKSYYIVKQSKVVSAFYSFKRNKKKLLKIQQRIRKLINNLINKISTYPICIIWICDVAGPLFSFYSVYHHENLATPQYATRWFHHKTVDCCSLFLLGRIQG